MPSTSPRRARASAKINRHQLGGDAIGPPGPPIARSNRLGAGGQGLGLATGRQPASPGAGSALPSGQGLPLPTVASSSRPDAMLWRSPASNELLRPRPYRLQLPGVAQISTCSPPPPSWFPAVAASRPRGPRWSAVRSAVQHHQGQVGLPQALPGRGPAQGLKLAGLQAKACRVGEAADHPAPTGRFLRWRRGWCRPWGVTMARFCPNRALNSELLPTLGRAAEHHQGPFAPHPAPDCRPATKHLVVAPGPWPRRLVASSGPAISAGFLGKIDGRFHRGPRPG